MSSVGGTALHCAIGGVSAGTFERGSGSDGLTSGTVARSSAASMEGPRATKGRTACRGSGICRSTPCVGAHTLRASLETPAAQGPVASVARRADERARPGDGRDHPCAAATIHGNVMGRTPLRRLALTCALLIAVSPAATPARAEPAPCPLAALQLRLATASLHAPGNG